MKYTIREVETDMYGNHHEISFARACAEHAKRPRTWLHVVELLVMLVGLGAVIIGGLGK